MLNPFHWLKENPRPPRSALLAAIPVHNQLVRASPRAAGLRLTAPRAATPLRRILTGADPTTKKSFDLDDLGAFVWHAIDGRRSVESLIEHFAESKRVNLREAEVAVLAFLKTLTQRNLIALAVTSADASDSAPSAPPRPRKKRRA